MPSALAKTERALGSPVRNLVSILIFMAVVIVVATGAYMAAGWSFADASYMVMLTIYTVGYGEVHPITTPYLHGVTMGLMVFGCTGMILLTSALVQFFTVMQLRELLGAKGMHDRIDKLSGHIIICGFGRIGVMLARELADAHIPLVVLERSPTRLAEAESAGHLVLAGDATEEAALIEAGIMRARTLATVLPDDAANVFITLSARNLNPDLEIIARGEAPTTERKLRHAGANHVVLPTHIGAERIARMVLYPESATIEQDDELARMTRDFALIGLTMERMTVAPGSTMDGLAVADAERRAGGAFFLVGIGRGERDAMVRPAADEKLTSGCKVLVVAKPGSAAALALFSTRAEVRAGRNIF
ncbi:potassium channel family protein [Sphingomonas sp. MMS24-J13]|uniref:potassium channel family protein n=1 Tax=Sphingomonas sp. MMS24-J13 TaxID=3238686 RepID=UPI00384B5A7F